MKLFFVFFGIVILFADGQNKDNVNPINFKKIYGQKISRHLNQLIKDANKKNHKVISIEKKGRTFYVKTAISEKFCEQRAFLYDDKKDQLNDLEIVSYCH